MSHRRRKTAGKVTAEVVEEEKDAGQSEPEKKEFDIISPSREPVSSPTDLFDDQSADFQTHAGTEDDTTLSAELVREKQSVPDESETSVEDLESLMPALPYAVKAEAKEFTADTEKSLTPFDPLRRYLWEIKRYPILSREDEHRLAMEYLRTGDTNIAIILITSNLRLVVKIALEFQKHWMFNLMDLIQEGNVGLMQAVKKFDPYRGTRLSSYSSFWIKAYILKFIIENWRLVKIGTTQSQRKLFFNLKKEKDRLDALGFNPAPQLLAERLDVKESEVVEMDQRLNGWELSLDAPYHEDSRTKHEDFFSTTAEAVDDQLADLELKDILHRKLNDFQDLLTERDRFIYQNRLIADKPMTLQEIGDRFGITRERARQIEERLKQRLKNYLKDEMSELTDLIDEHLH